ncbi:hypothetical protein Acr_04g0004920 [Actinidia rufa]|uniref:Uncharacterized protein n=1 Tax=Actinidia rufa TaxID=165716 RepID=A0A7J0EGZ4_9ERIC|nr:hypothetical protein Acr_04g0004920 [Actinidia rufa]
METTKKSSDLVGDRDAHAREDRFKGEESNDLVASAEASVLRAESVAGLARREDGDDGVLSLNTGVEPGGVAAALSLLLHHRPPLPASPPPVDSSLRYNVHLVESKPIWMSPSPIVKSKPDWGPYKVFL